MTVCSNSQVESDSPVNDANPHIVNIGRMVEVYRFSFSPVLPQIKYILCVFLVIKKYLYSFLIPNVLQTTMLLLRVAKVLYDALF